MLLTGYIVEIIAIINVQSLFMWIAVAEVNRRMFSFITHLAVNMENVLPIS